MFPVIAVTISTSVDSETRCGRGASFGNYASTGILLINTRCCQASRGAASTVMQERMDGTQLQVGRLTARRRTPSARSQPLPAAVMHSQWRSCPVAGRRPARTIPCEHRGPRRRSCRAPSLLPLAVVVGATLRSPRQLSLASISVMLILSSLGAFHPGSIGRAHAGGVR